MKDQIFQIFKSFSNREIATVIWICVFLAFAMRSASVRKSMKEVLRSILQWKISSVLIALCVCQFLVTWLLYKLHVWDWYLMKDTVVWYFVVGVALLFKMINVVSPKQFRRAVFEGFSIVILVEFIMNFYTYSLVAELIVVPIVTLFVMTKTYVTINPRNDPQATRVKKPVERIVTFIGIVALCYALYRTISEYQSLFTFQNAVTLALPILYLVFLLPFFYLFVLLLRYESLFVRLGFSIRNDPQLLKKAKWISFTYACGNLSRIEMVSRNINMGELYRATHETEVKEVLTGDNRA